MTNTTSILRLMQASDVSDVLRIEQQAYRYPWPESSFKDCLQPQYVSWLLCQDDQTIGYLIVQSVVDELHLLNICVATDYQNQGYGQQLMRHCIHFAKSQQLISILLEVRQSNRAAKKLYAKWQFELIGTRKNYYPCDEGREDAAIYRLSMSPP